MKIAIRTDASVEIGTGHVMRCLTLAKQLAHEDVEIIFISRDFQGNSIQYIETEGFKVFTLPASSDKNHLQWMRESWRKDAGDTAQVLQHLDKEIDLLIVDHYSLDVNWEKEIRPFVHHIMVIDDLADRIHDCDILLDQNFYLNLEKRYEGLVPASCQLLLGPNYVLLRDEFLSIDTNSIKRDGTIKKILVFFGGTDPTGETLKTLKAISECELNLSEIEVNVVVGAANPQNEEIEAFCNKRPQFVFHCQVNNMAELMVKSDLAIGAGGSTSWERCFLELPALTIIVADNQKELSKAVANKGAVYCLGESSQVTSWHIANKINEVCRTPMKMIEIINKCNGIVDPEKVKRRLVVKKIMEFQK
ncbi:UDP-2,4-diacetamido-2,4,6-trideoxy-beta-L-altropyranose hydrolase [Domibacillus epiphyticus]|uniref:UDP-2,4-diacetamido-2,4, 6-trideoxy-beta-L-altropyranose hydrolase n=1 Tax=Domibacillus epiphyticus TaxID=1714355 RepID=A0A1V2A4L0_9BACI|nr:UDP-2,4-diacetamido-2,4,6-trideoxy-beta-L-altropyranose hydrolase [Domibacillus epiphyticus]OMP65792.1 UDP-2,4-diacetamido-2,4,6-trideoxy-beta-L-altropyranose hydrolase [Domibacillus epiphyticus]